MYVPDFPEEEPFYQGTFTHALLSGTGNDSALYRLYGETPASKDGFKKRVRISDGYSVTQLYENEHWAMKSCNSIKHVSDHESYSYIEYATVGIPQTVSRLFTHKAFDYLFYEYMSFEDGERKLIVSYKFDGNSMTWTKL